MRSLRAALGTWLLAGLGAAVVGVGLVTHREVTGAVEDAFDASLAARVQALASLCAYDEDGFELDLAERDAGEYLGGPSPAYFEIWVEDGDVVARSPTLGDAELPRRAGAEGVPALWDLALPDGRAGRAAGLLVRPAPDDEDASEDPDEDEDATATAAGTAPAAGADGAPGAAGTAAHGPPRLTIVTARSREDLDATLAGVRTVFVAGGALCLLLIVLVVHVAVRRALRPVAALGARLDAIDADSLSARLPADGLPEELARIPPTLNALLERLQLAFRRERRMTGNVAHELRTPLAELRTAVELARRWPEDAALRDTALGTAHDVALRMGRLVETLLRLSRVASGQAVPAADRVALDEALDAHASRLAERARARGQELRLDVPAGLAVRTDRELLDVALGNLLANAVQHAPPDRPIRCVAALRPAPQGAAPAATVRLTVINAAPALAARDLPRLVEPFWSGDASRSDGGTGLGLALADTVAGALGAALSFELLGGELHAHLDLPAADARGAPAPDPAPAPA